MNPAQIASVKEMLKDGPVRVSDVKAKLKLKRDTRIGELAEELKAAGFTLQKWERTWIVTAVPAEIESESKPEPESVPANAGKMSELEIEDVIFDALTSGEKTLNELADIVRDKFPECTIDMLQIYCSACIRTSESYRTA